jgi:hypothetical protein
MDEGEKTTRYYSRKVGQYSEIRLSTVATHPTRSLGLELSPKVLQSNGEVFRATIPQSPEQSLLFCGLDPTFKVAPAQCLILGLVRQ